MRGKQEYGVPDEENPEWTAEDFAAAKPFAAVFPDLAAKEVARRGRGPQKRPTKQMVSLRLDVAVLEQWRATGKGWQGRMNATLATHAPRPRGARTASPRRVKRTAPRRSR
jgi:uncharacterized protein (DUF4415 family)